MFANSKTRFAVGLVAAATLSLGSATTAEAVNPPPEKGATSYELDPTTSDQTVAAHVLLTWWNGYPDGRMEVRWEVTDLQGAIQVDIDGHVYSSNKGDQVGKKGKAYRKVSVRGCSKTYKLCGSWI